MQTLTPAIDVHHAGMIDVPNVLLKACINHLSPSQANDILDELPFLRERGFPEEWSSSEILWSYTD